MALDLQSVLRQEKIILNKLDVRRKIIQLKLSLSMPINVINLSGINRYPVIIGAKTFSYKKTVLKVLAKCTPAPPCSKYQYFPHICTNFFIYTHTHTP